MLFSSLTFLFYFLPVVVLIHRFLPEKWQNPFLFAASLVFYAWGEIRYVPLFFALLIADYGLGLLLDRTKSPAARRWLLAAGVALDIGALLYYKYSGFLLDNLGLRGRFSVPASLPLGISFFTFQAVGYLIDVFRRRTEAERDIFAFGAFLFLFPQLIAGPIVRYGDLKAALHTRRKPDGDALDRGMALFIAGLASKVLLANPLGALSNELHAVTGDCACQWAHLTAYTLHIYFDFWGYSVMTLGMGRMLGFRFPHNFNHPYAAASITDFWRRWHMTLGGWFRDYVYIPLGGSRKGTVRTLLNMLVVWALSNMCSSGSARPASCAACTRSSAWWRGTPSLPRRTWRRPWGPSRPCSASVPAGARCSGCGKTPCCWPLLLRAACPRSSMRESG